MGGRNTETGSGKAVATYRLCFHARGRSSRCSSEEHRGEGFAEKLNYSLDFSSPPSHPPPRPFPTGGAGMSVVGRRRKKKGDD
ncbi:hypothetical protein LX36DRAFT_371876 [Colletotrichum falcatum]|nr:hypothetical protein LX36DRAFT_371876 [Colletotrichum falcatum]